MDGVRLAPPHHDSAALPLFQALPLPMAVRDAQELMTYPFFALGKSRRTEPISFRTAEVSIRVEGTLEHGLATIWDADVLLWAISQVVEAQDCRLTSSRRLSATPWEILTFLRRGTSARDYLRLKAALDRLQSTSVATSIRQAQERRLHRFSWLNEWKECADDRGRPQGIELILPYWLYAGICDSARVLTIDPRYFGLTGGVERWLYRLLRKHAGTQPSGWSFDFPQLHRKSGSLARPADFALDLRRIVARQSLPGYRVSIVRRSSVESLVGRLEPAGGRAAPPHRSPVDKT